MQHKEVWALALGRVGSILALPLPCKPWVSWASVPYLLVTCHRACARVSDST